jgi:hypothetical protein
MASIYSGLEAATRNLGLVVENVSTIILSMVYVGPSMVAMWGFLVKLLRIT